MPEAEIDLHDLQVSVELALEMLNAEATVVEAEVCASWCEQQAVQVHYEAERSAEGVQAPRVTTTFGIGVLLVIEDQQGRRIGFGSDSGDLSPEAITLALEKAKANAVLDPHFSALPRALDGPAPLPAFYDPQVVELHPDELKRLAFEALDGALSACAAAGYVTSLVVQGSVRSRTEHMVVGNTHGLLAAETSTGLVATMLCRLLQEQSQGTGSSAATHLQDFSPQEAGAEAVQQALQMRGSVALAGGDYAVVLSSQAVADLMQELLIPALSLDTVAAGASPFTQQLGQQVAAALLTVTDIGRRPRALGSRGMTGEGLPTGTTTLIEQGRLTGFLTDVYHAQKLAAQIGVMPPHNGMRFAPNGASFAMRPGIFPTNVVLTSPQAEARDALLAAITDGICVGGLWYTSPVGGLQTGDFTSTVIGPSFHIRHGKLAEPLRPGALRLQDNYLNLLHHITGISTTQRAVVLATMQSLVLAPELRCSTARFVA
jgi:PmbA protein